MDAAATTNRKFRDNGNRIRKAREAMRPYCSQENFAPLIGTSRRHLIRLEGGQHLPGNVLRDRIVEVTGTTEKIESADDDDEDALLRTLMSRVPVDNPSGLSLEGWLLMFPKEFSRRDITEMRRQALRDIRRSFEIERVIT